MVTMIPPVPPVAQLSLSPDAKSKPTLGGLDHDGFDQLNSHGEIFHKSGEGLEKQV